MEVIKIKDVSKTEKEIVITLSAHKQKFTKNKWITVCHKTGEGIVLFCKEHEIKENLMKLLTKDFGEEPK